MARLNTLALAASFYLTTALAAIGPVTDLHIVNREVAPDGIRRPAVLANGQFPGPLIKGNKGDNFQINVIDELTDPTMLKTTSIHWHGMFQHGTNWADGPAFVNQCPITSGDSFLYNFNVPDQAGTFWYHSHLATQYCDGLRGPMVVYDPFDPHRFLYDVDNEDTIITLGDWYNFPVRQGPKLPKKGANATVINGLGRSTNTTNAELAVITVEHGKRYRFRLVSISCEPNYVFQIDNHTVFTVIEADAVNTEPLEVDSIQIFAAQRYSFVLHADQPVDNYWIRANPNLGDTGFEGGINSAILRYRGAPIREPTTKNQTSTRPLSEVDLHPLENPGAPGLAQPGGVDIPLNLLFDFNTTNFFINNATFVPPTVPVLLQILSGAQNAHALIPSGSVFTLQPNSIVEISMPGGVPGGGHPFHLHGHTFDVVRSAGSDVYNYKNPIRRDTVNTGVAGDNVTIRFETNNAGPWFFHCHIDFHLDAGFAVVFAEDDASVNRTDPVPQAWKDLCPTYDALPLIDH